MAYEVKETKDGSFTLYSSQYDECYHSPKDGALTEALHKHVIPAFSLATKKHLNILDICFGLGFNTLATLYFLQHQSKVKSVDIYSPELDEKLLTKLKNFTYPSKLAPFFEILHILLEDKVYMGKNCKIELFIGDARAYVKRLANIDVVYQDAFSPKKNPTLWTVEYFQDIYNATSDDALLTTYSIASPVRLALWEVGFRIYEIEPKGTKKITIASKKTLPLKEIDMDLKAKRSTSKPLRDKDVE